MAPKKSSAVQPAKEGRGKKGQQSSEAAEEKPNNSKRTSTLYKGNDVEFLWSAMEAIQLVHQSLANFNTARKLFTDRVKTDEAEVLHALEGILFGVMKQSPSLAPDALRRHNAFFRDLCKCLKEILKSDRCAVALLEYLLPYGTAANRSVRLYVVSLFEDLLRTLDPTVETPVRQQFYEVCTQMLKQRIYDVCPHIREKAVAAISSFQSGLKSDDVTCNMVSILVEDTSADVRRQALRGIQTGQGHKDFLHGYFASMVRSTRDTVAKVREAAWEALHRFKWQYVNHYCRREGVDMLHYIALGLGDPSQTVATACRLTVMKSWLPRDAKDDCATFIDAIGVDFREFEINLASAERVAEELLRHHRKSNPVGKSDTERFRLRCQKSDMEGSGLTFGNVLMWKVRCEEVAHRNVAPEPSSKVDDMMMQNTESAADEEESRLLIPLHTFTDVLVDVMMLFAKPDSYVPRTITLKGSEVEEILRLMLSTLDVYEECGYLAHIDNTTRTALLKHLGFLLKVVPDNDPSLFVDTVVKAVKMLTPRHEEEASIIITDALGLLFSGVQLRKENALTFEDVEFFGRLDDERRGMMRELKRKYGPLDEEVVKLESQIAFDQKFLLRMQHIVFSFLSYTNRLEKVPPFCLHMVQLGRNQCDEEVKVVATRSLTLLCLIGPDSVHTFMPVLMNEAKQGNAMYASPASNNSLTDVPTASLVAMFDIVCEYGLKFFDAATSSTLLPAAQAIRKLQGAATSQPPEDDDDLEGGSLRREGSEANDEERRRAAEQAAQAESAIDHRGGVKLLQQLASFLTSNSVAQRQASVLGFCKLLSCNRVPVGRAPQLLSEILTNTVVEPSCKKSSSNVPSQHLLMLVHTFLSSFSSSSPLRQGFLAEAGILSFRRILACLPNGHTLMTKLLLLVVRLTDAAVLKQVRDADPEFAKQVATEYRDEAVAAENMADGGDPTTNNDADVSKRSQRMNAAMLTKQIAHIRVRHELSKSSLHEFIALELLTELVATPTPVVVAVVVNVLPRLRFYCMDPEVSSNLVRHCEEALLRVPFDEDTEAAKQKLEAILDVLKQSEQDALKSAAAMNASVGGALVHPQDDAMIRRLTSFEERLRLRNAMKDIAVIPPVMLDDDGSLGRESPAREQSQQQQQAFYAGVSLGFSQEAFSAQVKALPHPKAPAAGRGKKVVTATKEKATALPTPAAPKQRAREPPATTEEEIELNDILGTKPKKSRK